MRTHPNNVLFFAVSRSDPMYHYTDRYNQTGTFRKFCEARGVSKNQIARWRPQIFDYLREELAAYAPV